MATEQEGSRPLNIFSPVSGFRTFSQGKHSQKFPLLFDADYANEASHGRIVCLALGSKQLFRLDLGTKRCQRESISGGSRAKKRRGVASGPVGGIESRRWPKCGPRPTFLPYCLLGLTYFTGWRLFHLCGPPSSSFSLFFGYFLVPSPTTSLHKSGRLASASLRSSLPMAAGHIPPVSINFFFFKI